MFQQHQLRQLKKKKKKTSLLFVNRTMVTTEDKTEVIEETTQTEIIEILEITEIPETGETMTNPDNKTTGETEITTEVNHTEAEIKTKTKLLEDDMDLTPKRQSSAGSAVNQVTFKQNASLDLTPTNLLTKATIQFSPLTEKVSSLKTESLKKLFKN